MEMYRNEMMKQLAFCYKDFTRNWITGHFSQKKILGTSMFLDLFS
jgi:hypothetical protein